MLSEFENKQESELLGLLQSIAAELLCCTTQQPMSFPAIDRYGLNYECKAAYDLNHPLPDKIPNYKLKNFLEAWRKINQAGKPLCSDNIKEILEQECSCSITSEIMQNPVVAKDGLTYERKGIETWFSQCAIHNWPITGPGSKKQIDLTLIPNMSLRRLIKSLSDLERYLSKKVALAPHMQSQTMQNGKDSLSYVSSVSAGAAAGGGGSNPRPLLWAPSVPPLTPPSSDEINMVLKALQRTSAQELMAQQKALWEIHPLALQGKALNEQRACQKALEEERAWKQAEAFLKQQQPANIPAPVLNDESVAKILGLSKLDLDRQNQMLTWYEKNCSICGKPKEAHVMSHISLHQFSNTKTDNERIHPNP
jgi:hypothetical protein